MCQFCVYKCLSVCLCACVSASLALSVLSHSLPPSPSLDLTLVSLSFSLCVSGSVVLGFQPDVSESDQSRRQTRYGSGARSPLWFPFPSRSLAFLFFGRDMSMSG